MKLGFLASHGGSNFKAIVESIEDGSLDAHPNILISNNPDANALKIAEAKGIPNYVVNKQTLPKGFESVDTYILHLLKKHDVELVVLAGYMKIVTPILIRSYNNRILNIHPALLPKHGGKGMYGMFVHQAVIRSQDKESGATVHLVNEVYDKGKILGQVKCPRYPKDTAETLAARVLKFEHVIYPQVLRDIKVGLIELD